MIFICFHLFWLDSNLPRNCFIELSSELGWPILERGQKNFGFWNFWIRSFKFSFQCIPVYDDVKQKILERALLSLQCAMSKTCKIILFKYRTRPIRPRSVYYFFHFFASGLFKKGGLFSPDLVNLPANQLPSKRKRTSPWTREKTSPFNNSCSLQIYS